MAGTWRHTLVRVDFSQECARLGPFIANAMAPFKELRVDEIQLGEAETTQVRRLQIKIVQKAITMAYRTVFGTKPDFGQRISHVSPLKIPGKLTAMIQNVFIWYGYEDCPPVYRMPFKVEDITMSEIHSWERSVNSAAQQGHAAGMPASG
jgi:hypothetical protein